MKTKLIPTAILFAFLCLINNPLSAQLKSNFKASLINHGIFASDSFETFGLDKNTVRPGISFNIGFIHSYPIQKVKNLQFNFGILYEYASYNRLKIERFDSGGLFKRKEVFQSQYILMPLELEYKYGKFSFAGGANLALNFYTKMTFKSCGSNNSDCELISRFGSEYNINNQSSEYPDQLSTLPDGALNFILTAGVYYQWKPRIKLGLLYRDFYFDNAYLHVMRNLGSTSFNYFNYQTNSLSISMLFDLR